jgi:hypothetical protein
LIAPPRFFDSNGKRGDIDHKMAIWITYLLGDASIAGYGSMSLRTDAVNVYGLSFDNGVTWSEFGGHPFTLHLNDIIAGSNFCNAFKEIELSACVLGLEGVEGYKETRIKVVLENNLECFFDLDVAAGIVSIRVDQKTYVSIDPRLGSKAANWYLDSKYVLIKNFFAWLGWNEVDPNNYGTMTSTPSFRNLLRFLAGWVSPNSRT